MLKFFGKEAINESKGKTKAEGKIWNNKRRLVIIVTVVIDFGVKSSIATINEITKKVENLGLKIEFKKVIPNECKFKLDYIDL